MSYNPSFLSSCVAFEATPAHITSAYQDLKKDMNPEFVHVFLDKLERYARKPDRALFLVEYQDTIIAFATVIERAPVPDELSVEQTAPLTSYSCGTGLMVLQEFQKRGVASLLVNQWEVWSRKKGCKGIWLVTKKMGAWYQNHFDYLQVGMIECRGVKKTILKKSLLVKYFSI
jgi:GNAT superfamily N-acetyltransferase